jgi:hypothetical protein
MEWIRDDDFFVILEDGSVWKWRIYTGFDIQTAFQCGLPLATTGIGWGLIALIRYTRRKSRSNRSSTAVGISTLILPCSGEG